MNNLNKDLETLGLKPGASPEEIKQAYRDLSKVWHPDRFSNDPRLKEKAQEKLKEINEAHKKLKSSIEMLDVEDNLKDTNIVKSEFQPSPKDQEPPNKWSEFSIIFGVIVLITVIFLFLLNKYYKNPLMKLANTIELQIPLAEDDLKTIVGSPKKILTNFMVPSKLKAACYSKGIILRADSMNILKNEYVGFFLVLPTDSYQKYLLKKEKIIEKEEDIEINARKLSDIKKLAEREGRRVVIFLDKYDSALSKGLEDNFGLSYAEEKIIDIETINGWKWCNLWRGLTLGLCNYIPPPGYKGIKVYLTTSNSNCIMTKIISEETKQERVVSIHQRFGKGEILFLVTPENFVDRLEFSDIYLNCFDNEKAAFRLLYWTAGIREYPIK
jgi:hypothetical protein